MNNLLMIASKSLASKINHLVVKKKMENKKLI